MQLIELNNKGQTLTILYWACAAQEDILLSINVSDIIVIRSKLIVPLRGRRLRLPHIQEIAHLLVVITLEEMRWKVFQFTTFTTLYLACWRLVISLAHDPCTREKGSGNRPIHVSFQWNAISARTPVSHKPTKCTLRRCSLAAAGWKWSTCIALHRRE